MTQTVTNLFVDKSVFNLKMVQFWKLGQYHRRYFTWDHSSLLLATFSGEENTTPVAKKTFDAILSTRSNLLKNESKLNEFLNSAFQYKLKSNPPQPHTKNHAADSSHFENEMKSMKDEISKLILQVTDLQSKLSLFKGALKKFLTSMRKPVSYTIFM